MGACRINGRLPLFIMKKQNIIGQIERINQQISVLLDREYNPEMSVSEQREISKRKKKLNKTKKKLVRRLDSV